ncbi:MAG TPA: carboxypeptidase-like regulatory domain-containing protein [Gemmatimonadaceae bacterium]|nr:carboxypeptidase-like regulatory domain-containing protein [Gemmatimonadaceae bacterium]
MRHLQTFFLATALIPGLAFAQSISGTLIVGEAGIPAPNARVWLTTTRGVMVDTARSDAQGRFTVRADRPGRYVLNVRRLGYFPETTDPIRLEEGEVRNDTVYVLSPRVMKPVDVIVRREVSNRFGFDIRALSSSQVITPEEIDRHRMIATDLADLLRWNSPAGLMITRTRNGGACYMLRRQRCAPVYVDGMLWGTDAWIPASEIESIVVIPNSEAFIRFGSSSGAIAVFTNIWSGR